MIGSKINRSGVAIVCVISYVPDYTFGLCAIVDDTFTIYNIGLLTMNTIRLPSYGAQLGQFGLIEPPF